MMHTLTLMRHAKSAWDDPSLPDHDRPLNARGEKAAKLMAKRLKKGGFVPNLVIVSSAQRARQTAAALQTAYHGALRLQTEPLLYDAPAEIYADVIRRVDEGVIDLMVIGHNPAMEQIVELLCGAARRMPTAAYLRVELPGAWRDFAFERFTLLDYDFPKSDR